MEVNKSTFHGIIFIAVVPSHLLTYRLASILMMMHAVVMAT